MKIYITQLEEGDLTSLIEAHVPKKEDLSIPMSLEIA